MPRSLVIRIALSFFAAITSVIAEEPSKSDSQLLGLMPKHETGALRFLKQHPGFDGRGVVVAIFDTGVDPGAAGLALTSDGKPKVIDLVDATGSGDVEMSAVRKLQNSSVMGLSGRVLKLNPEWKVTNQEVRIGIKVGYELYPKDLVPRIREHRQKRFQETQRRIETDLRNQIENFAAAQSKVEKTELEARLERLIAAGQSIDDPGPIYDCLVFFDGTVWRAAVDTDEDGDLADEKLLTNFRSEHQYATFDEVSLLNFAVNIYDSGKTLSLIVDANPHGTHVAGIVAANFPEEPAWNGVAPGAQIVSVKIGDTYIDGMETPAGLTRAAKAVLDNKCDLINMSFGEPTKTPDKGFITKLYDELVDKHGVIFCASAGNAGPALSTVGAPGGTTTSIIGVGAYVSPEMMAAQYALRERLPGIGFTWTSRGPTFDGSLGVDLFAPGAAIAPVPLWTLDRSMRMNGTSMASPNCCGNMALVLSGLKAKGIKYSPNSVERAFANTARRVTGTDVFAQGAGLIQTDKAFDALLRDTNKNAELLRFDVRLPANGNARGIYLRDWQDFEYTLDQEHLRPKEFQVRVLPTFAEGATSQERTHFQLRLELKATEKWLQCGEQITVTSHGQTFGVRVNLDEAPIGASFGEILGIDPDDRERGPLFRLPVTLLRPDRAGHHPYAMTDWEDSATINFEPGQIDRRFHAVPDRVTWAELRLKLISAPEQPIERAFMVHAVQMVPGQTYRDHEFKTQATLRQDRETRLVFPVEAGRTMEIAIAQYWSSLGPCSVQYSLEFLGLMPDQRSLVIPSDQIGSQVEVGATHLNGPLQLSPTARLTTYRRQLKPTKHFIKLLSPERDAFDQQRLFRELELSYEFEQSDAGAVTPQFGLTDDLLYDSEYGGVLWAIFETHGRRVATDDAWSHAVNLGKGKYVLKLWIRHFEHAKLERLTSMPLTFERPLPSAIALPVFAHRIDAVSNGPRFAARWLKPREQQQLFIGNVLKGQIPSSVLAGDVLSGTISYGGDHGRGGANDRPGGFAVSTTASTLDVPSISGGSEKTTSSLLVPIDETAPKDGNERVARAVRDAKLKLLQSLSIDSDRALFDQLALELSEQVPVTKLQVAIIKLHKLDDPKKREERLDEIVAAADAVLGQLMPNDIALALGSRASEGDSAAAKKRQQAETQKALLIDTLYRKGRALGHMELPEVLAKKPIADQKAYDALFEKTFVELTRWADTTEQTHFLLHIRRATKQGKYAESLKWLDRYIPASAPNYWYLEKRRELFEKLEWPHLEDAQRRWRLVHFPSGEPQ